MESNSAHQGPSTCERTLLSFHNITSWALTHHPWWLQGPSRIVSVLCSQLHPLLPANPKEKWECTVNGPLHPCQLCLTAASEGAIHHGEILICEKFLIEISGTWFFPFFMGLGIIATRWKMKGKIRTSEKDTWPIFYGHNYSWMYVNQLPVNFQWFL